MYFYRGFCQAVWLLTRIPLNFIYSYIPLFFNHIHIIYQYRIATNFSCCFLEEFHMVLLLATTWRPNLWVLRKIWLSECLPFENHFFLIINQKVGYPAIYIYTVYFPKLLLSWKTTKYCFHKTVLYLQDILLTCNGWKYLCWTHFYNLVASLTAAQITQIWKWNQNIRWKVTFS